MTNENRQPAIRVVLLPRDTNQNGTIFGGIILSYIDLAGATQAMQHTKNRVVTVAMNQVIFKEPVRVGETVSFYASTIKTGRTSISVHVEVEVNRRGQTESVPVTHADLTFVSIDSDGNPIPL